MEEIVKLATCNNRRFEDVQFVGEGSRSLGQSVIINDVEEAGNCMG